MYSSGSISRWSCTKLRHFFESKSPKWMSQELSLSSVIALEMKLKQCSKDVDRKISYVLKLTKNAIAQRDRA